ncbi:hypothetical protein, partial [Parabacteroides goldsteinii]|uniref:hypothetical protein n=1 Tax=Parabacteroides goldsteinii TaxID=328812 RepID=UPI00261FF951
MILTDEDGRFREKCPFPSVIVPIVVPSTTTLTPGMGSLDSSFTTPFMVIVCCVAAGVPTVCSFDEVGMFIACSNFIYRPPHT